MKNATKLLSNYPIAASMGYALFALFAYGVLATILSRLDGGHGYWIVPCVESIYLLMTFLMLTTPLVIAVASAYKTNKMLGQRVAKHGYLIVLAFLVTLQISGFIIPRVFLLVSKTFGIQ